MVHDPFQVVHIIDREGEKHLVPWLPGESLMEALRDNGMPVLASCGGVRACATCHVYIEDGMKHVVGKRGEEENDLLSAESGFRPDASRLSCQIPYDENLDGMTVTLASD